MTKQVEQAVKRIALTGGIASGKSLVQEYLTTLGVPVIDADDITHTLYQTDAALRDQVRREFGEAVFTATGDVDRTKLGPLVFGDPHRLALLSGWIHPKVRQHIEAFFEKHTHHSVAVTSIPLLYESNLQDQYDEVWVVTATPDQQKERLVARSQKQGRPITPSEAGARIQSQIPLSEKVRRADVVIDNTKTKEHTRQQVYQLVKDRRLAAERKQ